MNTMEGCWRSQLRGPIEEEVLLPREHPGGSPAPPIIFTLRLQDRRCSSGLVALAGWDAPTSYSWSPSVLCRPRRLWYSSDTAYEDNSLDEQPRSPPLEAPVSGTTARIHLRSAAAVCGSSEAIWVHRDGREGGGVSQYEGGGRGRLRAREYRQGEQWLRLSSSSSPPSPSPSSSVPRPECLKQHNEQRILIMFDDNRPDTRLIRFPMQ